VRLKQGIVSVAAVLASSMAFQGTAFGQEMKSPRWQHSLQMMEVARAHLEMAEHQGPAEIRDAAHELIGRVDGTIHDIYEQLRIQDTRRTIEPLRAEPVDRPVRAAREELSHAVDELLRGVKDSDYRGRSREILDQERREADRAAELSHREEALMAAPPPAPVPAPPPVVEVRHPHLQHAVQLLEIASEDLGMAEEHAHRDWRDDAHRAREDTSISLHDALDALASAHVERTVPIGHAEPTDHPVHRAYDALREASDELEHVSSDDYHGHERRALEHARFALDEVTRLERHEEYRR
jgi:hypothetical protein